MHGADLEVEFGRNFARGHKMVSIGIVGASGYGGGELMRLLSSHPDVSLKVLISETNAGSPPYAAFPGLRSSSISNMKFESFDDGTAIKTCDIVFLAQDNGKAMQLVPNLLAAGCKVIDLSADFRFTDPAIYPEWYGFQHAVPLLLSKSVYGLPELNGEQIKGASLVGNPGCYVTATVLALAPLIIGKFIDAQSIIVDAVSGVSGAGRSKYSQDYHFPEANENVSAYKVGGKHRHIPEIEQILTLCNADHAPVRISFTPHLVPMSRGILATSYANLNSPTPIGRTELLEAYRSLYAKAPFVHLYESGTPASKHALGSNNCLIGIEIDERTGRVIVISALDNLVKGMAGQAIQNMNLMCGFDETAGLMLGGVWP